MNKAEFCTRVVDRADGPATPLAPSWTFCSPRPANMASASGGGGRPCATRTGIDGVQSHRSTLRSGERHRERAHPRTHICCAGGFNGSLDNAGSVHVSQAMTQPGMTGSFTSPSRSQPKRLPRQQHSSATTPATICG